MHSPNDGHFQLGSGRLAGVGDSISQTFYIGEELTYTIDLWMKSLNAQLDVAIIQNDSTLLKETITISGNEWAHHTFNVGLSIGTYQIQFVYVDNPILIDDVCIAHIPITRTEIANAVHNQLGELATSFGLSPTGESGEGDYTNALDAVLRQVGAIDRYSTPSVKCLHRCQVATVIEQTEKAMLKLLHNRAAIQPTQRTVGPVSEQFALLKALEIRMGMLPGQSNGGGVVQTRLIHKGMN